jgi:cytochrome c biogenesis protein CcmG/thiol:disulfide interchange protein DsbE
MTGRAKLIGQIAALACVAGLLALLVWKLTHQQHAPRVGSPAPAFKLQLLDGTGPVTLESLRGHPVVLNFWASWCESCKTEAPVLQRYWLRSLKRDAHHLRHAVAFLGVDDNDLTHDATTFVVAHHLTFPILVDGSGDVTRSYGISQLPETYIIGANGKVVAHFAGPIDSSEFTSAFRKALGRVS